MSCVHVCVMSLSCACSYIQFGSTTSPQFVWIRGFCVCSGLIGVLVCFLCLWISWWGLSLISWVSRPTMLTAFVASQSASMVDPPFLSPPPPNPLSPLSHLWIPHQASPYKSFVLSQSTDHFLKSPSISLSLCPSRSLFLCGGIFWLAHKPSFTTPVAL